MASSKRARSALTQVDVGAAQIDRYRPLVGDQAWAELHDTLREESARLKGHRIWNVNSTARGGGVAELLAALIPYSRGAGIDERWVTIQGNKAFFAVTKRFHVLLHGVASDRGDIIAHERAEYERVTARNAEALTNQVSPGDVVILHDPQTAGLANPLLAHGAHVIWRSHIGVDEANDVVRKTWTMLEPYIVDAEAYVFSRRSFVWEGLDEKRVRIIPPAIDAFTPKNQDQAPEEVAAILATAEIFEPNSEPSAGIKRRATMSGPPLPANARIVLQVSRWDRLKDPAGVMEGFAKRIAPHSDAHLVLAGPASTSVQDDPEQPEVLADLQGRLSNQPPAIRDRIRIAQLPMADGIENATIVNALQHRADVVVQKSLAEGFGLTVTEAMWKRRPVVASRVGGIGDQIEDGVSGILVQPRDLEHFGNAVVDLLTDREKAERVGRAARARVTRLYLAPDHLIAQARLILSLI